LNATADARRPIILDGDWLMANTVKIPAAKEFTLLDRGPRLLKNKGKLTMRRQENTEKVFLDVFQ
jgi:hypothetical protein